jgi:hypothetical protein
LTWADVYLFEGNSGRPKKQRRSHMPRFLFSYRVPKDYQPGTGTGEAWQAWFDGLGESQIELGNAVVATRTLGTLGEETRLGGYSILAAEDMDAAVALADGCPALDLGGAVEIGAVPGLPGTQPATTSHPEGRR